MLLLEMDFGSCPGSQTPGLGGVGRRKGRLGNDLKPWGDLLGFFLGFESSGTWTATSWASVTTIQGA